MRRILLVRQPFRRWRLPAASATTTTTTSTSTTAIHGGSCHAVRWFSQSSHATPSKEICPINATDREWMDTTSVSTGNPVKPIAIYKYWTNNEFVTTSQTASLSQQGLNSNSNNASHGSSNHTNHSWLPVHNPATGEEIAYVVENTSAEFDQMVAAAEDAFQEWRRVPPQQRQRVFLEYQRLIRLRQTEIAQLITLENGKTITDAEGDVYRGLEVVEQACNTAVHLLGQSLAGISSTMDCISYREPLGVCAGICPFNFPAMIPLWMFPLAIAAGNTFILKPSEKTPGAALLLAKLFAEAGAPPNLLQIVHGSIATVDRICQHDSIRAISFVGSNTAGEYIFQQGTARGNKRVQANLGAKNHAVILPDADRNAVVRAIVGAAFGAAGQRCMALSVVILVGEAQAWIHDIAHEASKLKVGPGWGFNVDVGPLITNQAQERVKHIVTQSIVQGAELVLDGRKLVVPGFEQGNFVGPTILKPSNRKNSCYREEIFGPVLICIDADSLDDAIQIINENPYGNGCAIFTSSGSSARQFQSQIQVTQVGISKYALRLNDDMIVGETKFGRCLTIM